MTIWESITDWMVEPPEMPRAATIREVERGIAVVAEVIAGERAREAEAARLRESARRNDSDAGIRRKTIVPYPSDDSGIRCKSDPGSVQCGGGDSFYTRPPKRRKPNLHAAALSFPARLLTYVKTKCGGVGKIAYYRSGVSRQVYSRVTCYDDSQADKLTVMKFCIGLQLERSAADLLMKSAGYAFSDTIPLDRAFTYAIENKMWNIKDVDAMLVRNSLPGLNLQF